jgi:hypothetical protein
MKFVMTAVVKGAPRRRATGNRFRFGGDDTRDKARWESWMIKNSRRLHRHVPSMEPQISSTSIDGNLPYAITLLTHVN